MGLLDDIEKELKKAKAWVGAEFGYIKEIQGRINKLSAENIKRQEHDIRAANRAFRYVGRSEYKASRIEQKLQTNLDKLMDELPTDERTKLREIRTAMNVPIANLKRHLSLYTGDLKRDLHDLALHIQLGEKYPKEKATLRGEIQGMQATIHNLVTWMQSLETELKNLEKFIAKLKVAV